MDYKFTHPHTSIQ